MEYRTLPHGGEKISIIGMGTDSLGGTEQEMVVGLINKYYDLAKAGDALAADHYRCLSVRADDCVQCGHCERSCPFRVKQMSRMEEIAKFFA